jgi:serine/threonine protein kinase
MRCENDDADFVLADFGFAVQCCGRNQTQQCGSPLYIAPEIIMKQNYGVEVDVWSFGVLLYILLGGYPPFHQNSNATTDDLYQNICEGVFTFEQKWWSCVSEDCKDLIMKLLQVDPSMRLTAREALLHPWFSSDENSLSTNDLGKALVKLRVWNAKSKLRAAVKAVLATKKISKLLQKKKTHKRKSEPVLQVIKEMSSFSERELSSFSNAPR